VLLGNETEGLRAFTTLCVERRSTAVGTCAVASLAGFAAGTSGAAPLRPPEYRSDFVWL